MTQAPKLNANTVATFLRVRRQMQDLLSKMSAFAARAPDLVVNKFKLEIINEQLTAANAILTGTKPFKGFDSFVDGALPTNSDVVVVLSQYLSCLEMWRSARVRNDDEEDEWYWDTDDNSSIKTTEPSEG